MEDGTLPFLDILALRHGFATLHRLCKSMERVQQLTFDLARSVFQALSELRHHNGSRVCVLYCSTGFLDPLHQGPIVNFNLLRPNGEVLGYHQVEKLAAACDIHLRTGCFCNTGACIKYLALNSEQLQKNLQQGHECGDSVDIIDGVPTGSVRVSFGYMSTQEDVHRFLAFIKSCFVDAVGSQSESIGQCRTDVGAGDEESSGCMEVSGLADLPHLQRESDDPQPASSRHQPSLPENGLQMLSCGDEVEVFSELNSVVLSPQLPTGKPQLPTGPVLSSLPTLSLQSITLYPVKSCAGFKVQQWPVGGKGLVLDREWMVKTEHGSLLSQKQEPKLCLIHPTIDRETWRLTLDSKGHQSVTLPSRLTPISAHHKPVDRDTCCSMRVCGDRVHAIDCGDEVAKWLTTVLGRKCRLIRQNYRHKRSKHNHTPKEIPVELSLANEAQYLLLTRTSLEHLIGQIGVNNLAELDIDNLAARFRANFIMEGNLGKPYAEDSWKELRIGDQSFQVVGKCVRCQMICVDPETGGRSPEPLKTLLSLRGSSVRRPCTQTHTHTHIHVHMHTHTAAVPFCSVFQCASKMILKLSTPPEPNKLVS